MQKFFPDKFYAILDYNYIDSEKFYNTANNYLLSGIKLIEVKILNKDKSFIIEVINKILVLKKTFDFSLILYENIEIVKELNLDGIHLDKSILSIEEVRKYLGNCIIGKACYSYYEAIKSYKNGADFLIMGPLFYSNSEKYMGHYNYISLQELEKSVIEINIPIVAFGGINLSNIISVIKTKVNAVTVVSNIFQDASPMEKVNSVISLFDGRYQKKRILTINSSNYITNKFSDYIKYKFDGIFINEFVTIENLSKIKDEYDLIFYCIEKENISKITPLEVISNQLNIKRSKLVILTNLDSHIFRSKVDDYKSLALLYIEDKAQFNILNLIIESIIKK